MKTYVISDIHGCYDAFINMLEKIGFTEEDQLILAGDYIDRGNQSFEMLKWIENAPDNVLLIKGNHDAEFMQCIHIILSFIKKIHISVTNNKDLYNIYVLLKSKLNIEMFDYYGTIEHLILNNNVTLDDLIKWKEIINNMPLYFKIFINGCRHIITHAGYIEENDFLKISNKYEDIESFYLYAREDSIKYGGQKDSIIVSGHTPTISKGLFFNDGNVFSYTDSSKRCTFYNIDCGKVYYSKENINAKLACIRLEDKKIFYC